MIANILYYGFGACSLAASAFVLWTNWGPRRLRPAAHPALNLEIPASELPLMTSAAEIMRAEADPAGHLREVQAKVRQNRRNKMIGLPEGYSGSIVAEGL